MSRGLTDRREGAYSLEQEDQPETSNWIPRVHEDPHSLLAFRLRRMRGESRVETRVPSNVQIEPGIYLVTASGVEKIK